MEIVSIDMSSKDTPRASEILDEDKTAPSPGRIERLLNIFFSFLKLGLTAFGGPAMVAYIRELSVRERRWLSEESFSHGVAICQSIPGATAMQVAAYVGLRALGPMGAIAAYVGFGLPAFCLMVALAAIYGKAHDMSLVISMFKGLQSIVVAIVANATWTFGLATIRKWQDAALALGAAGFLVAHGSPVVAIAASGLLGVFLYRKAGHGKESSVPTQEAGPSKGLRAPLILIFFVMVGLLALYALDRKLFDLATLMLKVDLFAFGGGYASVPLMLHEVVDVRHWMDSKTFMDGIALGQVTPGPIVITATFVGYLLSGIYGALVGTVAIFTPSITILMAVVPYFDRLQRHTLFKRCLRGVLVSFVGLLLAVTIHFSLAIHWVLGQALIAAVAFVAFRMRVDILWVVLGGAGVSMLFL